MDDRDIELRNATYRLFVETGAAPAAAAVARVAGLEPAQVEAGWRRLHEAHALVLEPGGTEIRMAAPFSAVPTAFRVQARGRWWYANCAWDAYGVCAALSADGLIETACPDCGQPIVLEVGGRCPDDERPLFHSLVPAAGWWDDIVFT
jgi:Alkylmercury lyase